MMMMLVVVVVELADAGTIKIFTRLYWLTLMSNQGNFESGTLRDRPPPG